MDSTRNNADDDFDAFTHIGAQDVVLRAATSAQAVGAATPGPVALIDEAKDERTSEQKLTARADELNLPAEHPMRVAARDLSAAAVAYTEAQEQGDVKPEDTEGQAERQRVAADLANARERARIVYSNYSDAPL